AQSLMIATLGGARALGLDHQIGSLVPGKLADIVAVDLTGLETQPLYDPLSQLVYASQRNQVDEVWVGGRHVVRKGCLTTLDEAALIANANQWRSRINEAE